MTDACACAECMPDFYGFRVCSLCGNKRCPHAASHSNGCTRSNESGQPGSLYPAVDPEKARKSIDELRAIMDADGPLAALQAMPQIWNSADA